MIYKFNDVTYTSKIDTAQQIVNFSVSNPKNPQKPESLFKYYALSKNSVDALTNHYLFSAHPMRLNDKYDCDGDLINYSKSKYDTLIKH